VSLSASILKEIWPYVDKEFINNSKIIIHNYHSAFLALSYLPSCRWIIASHWTKLVFTTFVTFRNTFIKFCALSRFKCRFQKLHIEWILFKKTNYLNSDLAKHLLQPPLVYSTLLCIYNNFSRIYHQVSSWIFLPSVKIYYSGR